MGCRIIVVECRWEPHQSSDHFTLDVVDNSSHHPVGAYPVHISCNTANSKQKNQNDWCPENVFGIPINKTSIQQRFHEHGNSGCGCRKQRHKGQSHEKIQLVNHHVLQKATIQSQILHDGEFCRLTDHALVLPIWYCAGKSVTGDAP